MAEDFRMVADFADSPKIKKLVIRLGEPAFRCWVRLLGYVRMNRPNGRLRNMDDLDLAAAASWNGNPKEFVEALIEIRLLDRAKNGSCKVHNWAKYNVYAIDAEKRRKQAQLAARARWNKGHNNLATHTKDAPAMRQHKKSNALPVTSSHDTTSHDSIRPDQSRNEEKEIADFVEKYHEVCAGFKTVRIINNSRKGKIRQRLKELATAGITVEEYMHKISNSKFLRGEKGNWDGADFDFIIGAENIGKILDGKYDNREVDNDPFLSQLSEAGRATYLAGQEVLRAREQSGKDTPDSDGV